MYLASKAKNCKYRSILKYDLIYFASGVFLFSLFFESFSWNDWFDLADDEVLLLFVVLTRCFLSC